MLKVYKPKGERVKADQITLDTVVDLAKMFMGRLTSEPASGPVSSRPWKTASFIRRTNWLGTFSRVSEKFEERKGI